MPVVYSTQAWNCSALVDWLMVLLLARFASSTKVCCEPAQTCLQVRLSDVALSAGYIFQLLVVESPVSFSCRAGTCGMRGGRRETDTAGRKNTRGDHPRRLHPRRLPCPHHETTIFASPVRPIHFRILLRHISQNKMKLLVLWTAANCKTRPRHICGISPLRPLWDPA